MRSCISELEHQHLFVMPRFGTKRQSIFELGDNNVNRKIHGIFLQDRKIGMTFICCLLSTIAHAECTPAPDCVELGYTETSCNGGFVRCPFDINKLFCLPCDSSYKYTCSETGEIGSGIACNGKYIECECTDGYELVNGACIVSCAYTLTALPTGCSAADSCVKNGTTYYSSTCTTCKSGYTISSGTCKANTCSGYYTSKTGCSDYSTCLSGTITTYKCTACETGYTLCETIGRCIDTNCYTTLIGNVDSCTDFKFEYCNKTYSCYGNYEEGYTAIPSSVSGAIVCGDFGGGVEP
ncbi:MAG: hypothetical protein IJX20_04145 [Alphaproteobacteria bacterium]|nr:hypothetical protein [Alphaproteobacteria bacterium]